MRRFLHRLALQAESVVDRVRSPRRRIPVLYPFSGYATPKELVLRGRTIEALRRPPAWVDTSRWRSLREMSALFATREVAGVTVSCRGVETRSDEEGYVTLRAPRPPDLTPGWHEEVVRVAGGSLAHMPVFVPDRAARRIVISDIDDTVMQTGAASRLRTIWTTLAGNVDSRRVFPDAIELLTTLQGTPAAPLFYISSSPWNLHPFLTTLFERRGVPRGPMFLRDFGLSDSQFIKGTHGEHKRRAIDTILEAVPGPPVVLIGDTGLHDAQIYADAAARWPGRVEGVILRQPHPRLKPIAHAGLARLEALPVRLHVGAEYRAAIAAYGR